MDSRRGGANVGDPVGARTPGCAVTHSGSRVVSTGVSTVPRPTSLSTSRIPGATLASTHISASQCAHGLSDDDSLYEPYVHVGTGARVLVPVTLDPLTGDRRLLHRPPDGYVHGVLHVDAAENTCDGTSAVGSLVRCIARMFDRSDVQPAVRDVIGPPPSQPPPAAPSSPAVPHQLQFGIAALPPPVHVDDERSVRRLALPSTTLDALRTKGGKLEVPDVADFLLDMTATLGQNDPDAHMLMYG